MNGFQHSFIQWKWSGDLQHSFDKIMSGKFLDSIGAWSAIVSFPCWRRLALNMMVVEAATTARAMKGLLYSFCSSVPDTNRLLEIADCFNESFDLVCALMMSSSVIAQLTEDKNLVATCVECSPIKGVTAVPNEIDCRSVLVAYETLDSACLESPSLISNVGLNQPGVAGQRMSGIQSIKHRLPFGANDLHIICHRRVERTENSVISSAAQELHYQQATSRLLASRTLRRDDHAILDVPFRCLPYSDCALNTFRFAMSLPINQPCITYCVLFQATLWAASVVAVSAAWVHFHYKEG